MKTPAKKISATASVANPRRKTVQPSTAMSHDDIYQKQYPLIAYIDAYLRLQATLGKPMTYKAFAQHSGITFSTVAGIMNGSRWVGACERATLDKLAAVLSLPVLQILVLAGFITPSDAVYTTAEEEVIDSIYQKMCRDKTMNIKMPPPKSWQSADRDMRIAFCMLYEQLIQKTLMSYAVSL